MTSPRRTLLALAATALLALLAVPGPAGAQATDPPPVSCITDNPVDPLGPGFLRDRGRFKAVGHPDAVLETAPYGINNRGQIVGGYDTAGFVVHGFLLDRGRYRTIDYPGAQRTLTLRINDRGQDPRQLRGRARRMPRLPLAQGPLDDDRRAGAPTQAIGLDDRGRVAGTYIDAGGAFHGFLSDRGAYTTIDVPGALQTSVLDINARGQILGVYQDPAGLPRAFVRRAQGPVTTIAVPGATMTIPRGINARGDVVGFYLDADLVRHGFLFRKGAFTTIDHPLAAADSQLHDLNDRGQIVGLYERGSPVTAWMP